MTEHPITPPPELVQQWEGTAYNAAPIPYTHHIARCAARWGADQELEACITWMDEMELAGSGNIEVLRAARRPKPLSLKEQALARTDAILNDRNHALLVEVREILELNRRALEQLDD